LLGGEPLDAESWLRILTLSIALLLVVEAEKKFVSKEIDKEV